MTGRPKPTKLKVLDGNPGRRELPKDEPKPRPSAPACAKDIDKEARKVWKRMAPMLERLGLLTEADGDMFAILCQIRSRLVAINGELDQKSDESLLIQLKVTIDGSGQEHTEYKPSPWVVMEKQYMLLFRSYATEFGLSPRGRAGLSINSSNGNDALRDLCE